MNFDDNMKSFNVGDEYSTKQKDIEGYTFKEVQGNPISQFKDTSQSVAYVYTKNKVISVKSTRDDNKPIHKWDTSITQPSSTHNTLPGTAENERMAIMSVGAELILLMVALIVYVFRFKRFKKYI